MFLGVSTLLIAGFTALAGAADTLPPVSAPEIVAGVRSCLAATGEKQVDLAKLKQDGWSAVSVQAGGKKVQTPPPILSKGNVLLMYSASDSNAFCAILAKVNDLRAVSTIADSLDRDLRVGRKLKEGKPIPSYWFPDHHIVQLATTGSPEDPGVRIAVGYQ